MHYNSFSSSQNFKIRLLLDCAPWRMLLPLQNLRMTRREVLALYPFPENKSDLGVEMCEALHEGREYQLQIEQEDGFFSEPYVVVELARKNPTTLGWELNFRFINNGQLS